MQVRLRVEGGRIVTAAVADRLTRIQTHLTQMAAMAERRGKPGRAAMFVGWREVVATLKASAPTGCRGCYYEGEEVNRCMTCDRMTWRVNNYTTREVV